MKTWASIAIFVVLVAVLVQLNPGDGKLIREQTATGLTYQLAENTLIGRSRGKKIWELKVDQFAVDQAERFIYLSGRISGSVFRDGVKDFWFIASEGVCDQRTRDLKLTKGIEITTRQGERVIAEGLSYQQQSDRVILTPPIQAKMGKYTLTADQVTLEIESERLIASGNVLVSSADNEEIRCSELYYYRDTDSWQIVGAVEISTWLDTAEGAE